MGEGAVRPQTPGVGKTQPMSLGCVGVGVGGEGGACLFINSTYTC